MAVMNSVGVMLTNFRLLLRRQATNPFLGIRLANLVDFVLESDLIDHRCKGRKLQLSAAPPTKVLHRYAPFCGSPYGSATSGTRLSVTVAEEGIFVRARPLGTPPRQHAPEHGVAHAVVAAGDGCGVVTRVTWVLSFLHIRSAA